MSPVVYDALLALHVGSGTLGLLLGPVAALVPKRRGWHTSAGTAYLAAVAVMATSALGLVASAPGRLWFLALVAVVTVAAALGGWAVRRRHRSGWPAWHVRLMAGSYISLVTAALGVNWDSPLAWAAPSLAGTPLVILAVHRVRRRQPPATCPAPAHPAPHRPATPAPAGAARHGG